MRLNPKQQRVIHDAVYRADPGARVVLFGSRVDHEAKGGDIDLLIISDRIGMRDEWKIRRDILDEIGWQKLDLVVRRNDQIDAPISRIALEKGIAL